MDKEPEFRRCDSCQSERTCFPYRGLWFCKGPSRCWQKRVRLHQEGLAVSGS